MSAADIVVGILMIVTVGGVLIWYLGQVRARKHEIQKAAASNGWQLLADGADQIKTDLAGTALLDHYGRIRNVVCVPVEGDAEDLRLFDYAYTRGPDGQRQRLELTAAVCRVVSERNFCIRPKKSRGFLSRLFGKVDPVPTGHGSLDEHYEIVVEPGVPVPHLSEGFADRLMRSGENVTIEMINSHALIYRRHERVAGRDLGSFADEAHSLATLLSRS